MTDRCNVVSTPNHGVMLSLILLCLIPRGIQSFSPYHHTTSPPPISRSAAFRSGRTVSFASLDSSDPSIPRHIAIIPDGNSRWAESKFLPLAAGHAAGATRAKSTFDYLGERNVSCVTLYIFSTENWNRSVEEVINLWKLLERSVDSWRDADANIRILGRWEDERLPLSLRDKLNELDGAEKKEGEMTICLAINYGGRQDILSACQSLISEGRHDGELSEEMLNRHLSTSGLPQVDMVIRTGGERRLSNFLLWDVAYAELYFSDVLWPDFDEGCLDNALEWFASRERRFGGR